MPALVLRRIRDARRSKIMGGSMGQIADWKRLYGVTDPADRGSAEDAARKLYEIAGAPVPKIEWIGSPAAADPKDQVYVVFLGPFTWGLDLPEPDTDVTRAFLQMAQASFGAMLMEDRALLCERPEELVLDEECRLHRPDGPVVKYRNGSTVFALDGIIVPDRVVLAPQDLRAADVKAASNQEVRRIVMERMGPQRFFEEMKMKLVHQDRFGKLYWNGDADTPAVVEVVDTTKRD